MPMDPTPVRVDTISTSSSKTFPSGVRTSTGNLFLAILFLGRLLGGLLGGSLLLGRSLLLCTLLFLLGLRPAPRALASILERLVDGPLHVEGALRQLVVLALEDLGERAHGLLDRHVLAPGAGERLGHEERLRQEALDLAGALHGELVLVRELVDAEDGDDVLELLVALEDLLHLGGHPV